MIKEGKAKLHKFVNRDRERVKDHKIFKLKKIPSSNSVLNSLTELEKLLSIIAMFCKNTHEPIFIRRPKLQTEGKRLWKKKKIKIWGLDSKPKYREEEFVETDQ